MRDDYTTTYPRSQRLPRAIQFPSTMPWGVGATLVVARHPGRHKACPYHKRPLASMWDKAVLRNRDNSIGKLKLFTIALRTKTC